VVEGFLAFFQPLPEPFMPKDYKPKVALARQMRRAMTEPEWLLWQRLKVRDELRLNFRRQHAIGHFILDFYSARAKLAVEVDGAHHYEDEQYQKDRSRDAWLNARGIEVYRIPAGDVYADAGSAADGVVQAAKARTEALGRK